MTSRCAWSTRLPVNFTVRSTTHDLYCVYVGRTTLVQEIAAGSIRRVSMPRMTRAFLDVDGVEQLRPRGSHERIPIRIPDAHELEPVSSTGAEDWQDGECGGSAPTD